MDFEIKKSFRRDTKKIKDNNLLDSILEIIEMIEQSSSISDIADIKKMEGVKNHYRIKLGDYRIGIFLDENKTVFLVRFLHRKDIYKYFP
jgi:mRNA interferase RelE/StbE